MMDDEDLPPGPSPGLQLAGHTVELPPGLEGRVLGALRRRGEIRARPWSGWPGWTAAFAAGLLLAVAGIWFFRPSSPPADPRPAFVLLLEEDAGFQRGTPAEEARRVVEYGAWAGELARAGHLVSGEKLAASGILLTADGSRPVPPPGPGTGAVGGYFILRASDLNEAKRLAATCPHLRYGGKIVVRQIETTS